MKGSRFLIAIVTVSLMGCLPLTPTFGLRPYYPENRCVGDKIQFDSVDSLQPVLRWETYPPKAMQPAAEQMGRIHDVTYDLNIWRSENESPSSIIYSRRGLPEAQHKMEEALQPCEGYFWTVRARFRVDGKERVSEWGVSARPWVWRDPSKLYGPTSVSYDEMVRMSPVVPHPNLYRFETPCPERDEERARRVMP
jgi:hypothetical protein